MCIRDSIGVVHVVSWKGCMSEHWYGSAFWDAWSGAVPWFTFFGKRGRGWEIKADISHIRFSTTLPLYSLLVMLSTISLICVLNCVLQFRKLWSISVWRKQLHCCLLYTSTSLAFHTGHYPTVGFPAWLYHGGTSPDAVWRFLRIHAKWETSG